MKVTICDVVASVLLMVLGWVHAPMHWTAIDVVIHALLQLCYYSFFAGMRA